MGGSEYTKISGVADLEVASDEEACDRPPLVVLPQSQPGAAAHVH
jgi:hypothetical protein